MATRQIIYIFYGTVWDEYKRKKDIPCLGFTDC
jgi:hypothetical protein